jgi:hypothetical protein
MIDSLSRIWNSLRNGISFSMLWDSVVTEADSLGIEPPVLPRQRRIPRIIDYGIPQSQHSDERVEDLYRRIYFATVDSAIAYLSQRFKSPAINMACAIETLLMGVINTAHHAHDWQVEVIDNILSHNQNDIDGTRLPLRLSMLGYLCQPRISVADTSDVIQLFSDKDTDSDRGYQFALTVPHMCIASHQLHSRKKLLQFKKAENISAINSHTEKTEPYCSTSLPS